MYSPIQNDEHRAMAHTSFDHPCLLQGHAVMVTHKTGRCQKQDVQKRADTIVKGSNYAFYNYM